MDKDRRKSIITRSFFISLVTIGMIKLLNSAFEFQLEMSSLLSQGLTMIMFTISIYFETVWQVKHSGKRPGKEISTTEGGSTSIGLDQGYVDVRHIELNSLLLKNENLLRVLCHDISNHITVVQSSLFMIGLETSNTASPKLSSKIQRAQKHNEAIIEILEHVKQLKSLDSGKASLKLEPVDLSLQLLDINDVFGDRLLEKNVRIEIQGADKPINILADKVSVRSNILNNLISNAIKFSPPGGAINIEIKKADGYVDLIIKDEGIGIPKKLIGDIFDQNKKTSRRGTQNEMGTGFGLPIVKMFVKYNRATIEASSEIDGPNRGTIFTVRFNPASERARQDDKIALADTSKI